jgi:hypothetical protein
LSALCGSCGRSQADEAGPPLPATAASCPPMRPRYGVGRLPMCGRSKSHGKSRARHAWQSLSGLRTRARSPGEERLALRRPGSTSRGSAERSQPLAVRHVWQRTPRSGASGGKHCQGRSPLTSRRQCRRPLGSSTGTTGRLWSTRTSTCVARLRHPATGRLMGRSRRGWKGRKPTCRPADDSGMIARASCAALTARTRVQQISRRVPKQSVLRISLPRPCANAPPAVPPQSAPNRPRTSRAL